MTVDAAYTGKDGLAAIETKTPDLVLLDLKLPDQSGFDILDAIKKNAGSANYHHDICSWRYSRSGGGSKEGGSGLYY